jgi:hypothetical protein
MYHIAMIISPRVTQPMYSSNRGLLDWLWKYDIMPSTSKTLLLCSANYSISHPIVILIIIGCITSPPLSGVKWVNRSLFNGLSLTVNSAWLWFTVIIISAGATFLSQFNSTWGITRATTQYWYACYKRQLASLLHIHITRYSTSNNTIEKTKCMITLSLLARELNGGESYQSHDTYRLIYT